MGTGKSTGQFTDNLQIHDNPFTTWFESAQELSQMPFPAAYNRDVNWRYK